MHASMQVFGLMEAYELDMRYLTILSFKKKDWSRKFDSNDGTFIRHTRKRSAYERILDLQTNRDNIYRSKSIEIWYTPWSFLG